jgi:DNA repair exonuclease SbcCD ATPase subunit
LGVHELFSLQLGDINTILIVIVGIVFAVVVVILIANALRRRTAMSHELSTAWEKKFEAIKPAATMEKKEQVIPSPQLRPSIEGRSRDLVEYSALQAELRESIGRLQRNLQEIETLKENETKLRNEILGLRTQISSLQERLLASQEEVRRLKTHIESSAARVAEAQVREAAIQPPAERGVPEPHPSSEARVSRPRRTCPTCGGHVRPKDLYCDSCGQLLPPTT